MFEELREKFDGKFDMLMEKLDEINAKLDEIKKER